MSNGKIVSVDREAAKEAVAQVGSRAKKKVARTVAAGSAQARRRARRAGRSAAGSISGKVADARRAVGQELHRRRRAALRRALTTCISISRKQTTLLERLGDSLQGETGRG